MNVERSDHLSFFTFSLFHPWRELAHGAFTRHGGVSAPPYDSLNVSFALQDDPKNVQTNRELVLSAMGWDQRQVFSAGQVHGRRVAVVGREPIDDHELPDTDALVTNEPGVLLLLKFADCLPIVLWDPVGRVVSLVHAGWRGTILGVAAAALDLMVERFCSRPRDVLVGIGPSIGPCCYRVGPEVAEQAAREFSGAGVLQCGPSGEIHFDLWSANTELLMRAGVAEENVEVARICTCCAHNLFFSHRAASGRTGRFGVVAGIRDE